MRNATIRQLQIFSVAASHLSFARAAENLHLTHAAISLQIKQLEEVSGTLLFERIGKRVFLTEAGEILLDHTRQILQSLKEADAALLALKGLKGGRIAVAVASTAEYFAPGLLAEFRRTQADVRIRLLIDNRDTVSRLLAGNEVDVAIMGRPPAELDAVAVSFAPHPLVIVASADHPLARHASVAIEDLAGETLIVRESGSGTRSAMEEFFQERSIKPRIGMEMGSNEAIKQAVVAGLGISFISLHTLGLELSVGRLCILKVEGTPVMRRWHIVRHRSKHLTPALAAFWDFVVEFAPAYLRRLV
ncbi:MAG: LysR family transcriptional regulator [Candidatus Accumulibacter sp.]|jgi:DNA-binding transcriptional LysR family regulator|uniref:LysR family transcriptional regulator n=2 Tax=Accumulibacter sp. TaxID=2053492 RepID=UPI001AC317B6|nr:LysR family transcriptional regulator [Accumulibacter sp.]MBK8115356.1 LysR family transcriptional regulator [Accumulibacter sp.]MBK8384236.1 LysR family transcriptional regulator [Accumulibacter sp.]MBK8579525.1 LysR family transcriptional regulator [Candidatus Accumulibacter propinquus]MBN8439182.1 LysR family transcriptional regulator [Accumulibacter sp.]